MCIQPDTLDSPKTFMPLTVFISERQKYNLKALSNTHSP